MKNKHFSYNNRLYERCVNMYGKRFKERMNVRNDTVLSQEKYCLE